MPLTGRPATNRSSIRSGLGSHTQSRDAPGLAPAANPGRSGLS